MATAQIRITADTAQAERALGSLNNALKSLAGLVTVGTLADQFVKLADASANLQNKLSLVKQEGQTTGQMFDAMAASALKLGAPVADITDLFTRMALNTKDLGLSQQEVLTMTESLTKGFQMAGMSVAETSGAVTQLGQAFAAGRVNGDELRSIIENLPIVTNQLAQNLGVTRGELKKLGSEGKISADELAKAIRDSGAALDEAYSNRIPTIAQSFNDLQTIMTLFVTRSEAGGAAASALSLIIYSLANVILDITEAWDKWAWVLELVATVFLAGKVLKGIRLVIGGLTSLWSGIGGIITGFRNFSTALGNNATALSYSGNGVGIFGRMLLWLRGMMPSIAKAFGPLITALSTVASFFISDRIWKGVKSLLGFGPQDQGQTTQQRANAARDRFMQRTGIADARLSPVAPPRRVGLGGVPGGGGGTGEKSNAELIAEATAERNKQYEELLKNQRDSLFLTQFEGNELELQQAILNANNQMQKEIKNSKGQIIGYTRGMTEEETRQLTLLIQQNQQAKARAEITRANTKALEEAGLALRTATMSAEDAAVETAIFKNRQQYGSAYTAELEAQDRIQQRQIYNLNQQAQVTKTLTDLTRARTQLEIANAAAGLYGSTQEGILQKQQEQMAALDLLRQEGIISEQSYLDQRVLMNQQAQDAILNYEKQIATARMQQAGVTNDAILKSVTDNMQNAKMIQQGGVVGAQGMLGALTNIMGSMGQTSEKAFKAYKALAIAQALISTYQAAAMAIAFPPGPPISLIYVAGAIAAGMAQVAAIKSQKFQGRALGGPVQGGTPYIVGERGPELFVPPSTGQIVRNDQLGKSQPVNVNFTIVANDTTGFDELITSRRGLITQIIRDAQQERGARIGF